MSTIKLPVVRGKDHPWNIYDDGGNGENLALVNEPLEDDRLNTKRTAIAQELCDLINAGGTQMANLQGAARADMERLQKAAEAARVIYRGCDTPEALADEILKMRADNKTLRSALGRTLERERHQKRIEGNVTELLEALVGEQEAPDEIEKAYNKRIADAIRNVRWLLAGDGKGSPPWAKPSRV